MTFRPLRAYKEINASLSELGEANATAEQRERLALVTSTSRFTHRSKKVVDDTMSLSAVLMRAGEVDEAQRLLAEVDRDVEQEKAALLQVMQEVSERKAARSHKMTRLRLAKMLVSAILGASLMTFSAFGVALANYFTDRVSAGESAKPTLAASGLKRDASRAMRRVELAPGVKVQLTHEQFKEYERLASKAGNKGELESFLRDMLPADVLKKVTSLLAGQDVVGEVASKLSSVKAGVKKASESSTSSSGSSSSTSNNDGRSGSSSEKKDDEEKDKSSGGDSKEEGCEDGNEEGDSVTPGGGCIPIVNKENPLDG